MLYNVIHILFAHYQKYIIKYNIFNKCLELDFYKVRRNRENLCNNVVTRFYYASRFYLYV